MLAAAAVGGYFAALDGFTQLAEKKKEVLILSSLLLIQVWPF